MIPIRPPDGIAARPSRELLPRLLAIRFGAFGDSTIALAALAAVRRAHPSLRIEVVTDPRQSSLFGAHRAIDRVWTFDSRASRRHRAAALLPLALRLRRSGPAAVADLQRCRWSRLLVAALRPEAHVSWDRFAPIPALDRSLSALEALGLGPLRPVLEPGWHPAHLADAAARVAANVPPGRPLIALNPAGAWATRYWPLERWVELARRLEADGAQIVLLPAPAPLGARVRALAALLPSAWVVAEDVPVAAAVVANLAAIVSEDSGLMHLAWTQGIPSVGIFGATRSVWSAPDRSVGFNFGSEDLPCGPCMEERCARGDVYCIDRVRVEQVIERMRFTIEMRRALPA